MITKAILIKLADKWLVRVWEDKEPEFYGYKCKFSSELDWLNSYKEYEVHPDYVDRFLLNTINFISSIDVMDEEEKLLLKRGIDLKPELIGFKKDKINKQNLSSRFDKTYAILKDIADERDYGEDFKKACSIVSESLDVYSVWVELFNDLDKWSRSTKSSKDTPIKINELKQKYTLKRK